MEHIIRILKERLIGKGMAASSIPAYIRDVAFIIEGNGYSSLEEFNRRLQLLGWDDFELDDHTLQLIITVFESDDLKGSDPTNPQRFEGVLNPDNMDPKNQAREANHESKMQTSL